MRTDLTIEDLGDLLDLPLLGTLATYDREGLVLLSPVWYEWWHGGFHLAIPADDVKSRHLRRDPHASLVVAELEPPMRGLEVRGAADLLPARDHVNRRIAMRYLPAEAVDAFLAEIGEGLIVRLEPGRLRAWDFSDDDW